MLLDRIARVVKDMFFFERHLPSKKTRDVKKYRSISRSGTINALLFFSFHTSQQLCRCREEYLWDQGVKKGFKVIVAWTIFRV